ncbi:hypothetical protein [Nonlabens ponticola]|uniref:Lipoprotein n=1 Tax=Nonlabens ponticola TaxID=2496866 RepID=A0A3S9N0N2_9FLAO|nr:hypothetical protein [Nonlabens ponticola]AZQ45051.1 hypothetical protein EJ995_12720 [Nonlabens ponticola]
MKQFKTILSIIIAALALTSCDNDRVLFKTNLETNDQKTNITYSPNLNFEFVVDSASVLLDNEDLKNALRGETAKGGTLYKSDRFQVKLFLTTFYYSGVYQYEFKLRTFSKDMKIIDSYTFSQTTRDPACAATLTSDLEITKSCEDGSEIIAQIDDYGKFIER